MKREIYHKNNILFLQDQWDSSKISVSTIVIFTLILAYSSIPFNLVKSSYYFVLKNYVYVGLLAILLLLNLIKKFMTNRRLANIEFKTFLYILFFWIWILIGFLISFLKGIDTTYATMKFRDYSALVILPTMVSMLLIKKSKINQKTLFYFGMVWLLCILISHVYVTLKSFDNIGDMRTMFGLRLGSSYAKDYLSTYLQDVYIGGPIQAARQSTFCALLFVYLYLTHRGTSIGLVSLFCSFTCFLVAFWAASRGAMLGFCAGIATLLYNVYSEKRKFLVRKYGVIKIVIMLFIIVVLAIVLFNLLVTGDRIPKMISKIFNIQIGYHDLSGDWKRLGLLVSIFDYPDYFCFNLFGEGLGSSYLALGGTKAYPHNIFIEVFFELGIIGLSIFCFVYIYWPMKLYQIRDTNDSIFLFLFSLYVASFVNALVSYDLKGNDMLPKLLMLIAILQSHKIFSKISFMKMSN